MPQITLDIRTLSFITTSIGILYAIGLFIFGQIQKKFAGFPMLAIASQYPDLCYPLIGLHPREVWNIKQLGAIEPYFSNHHFVAIGEIGMDCYRKQDRKQITLQRSVFRIQLGWAEQYDLPVVLHSRGTTREVLTILKEEKARNKNLRGIFHCFTGNVEEAQEAIALGFYIGIGGMVTFLKNDKIFDLLRTLDLSHMVLETDAPYLAPEPYRGRRNEPAYLLYTAKRVAVLKGTSVEEVAAATTANAIKIFGAPVINR